MNYYTNFSSTDIVVSVSQNVLNSLLWGSKLMRITRTDCMLYSTYNVNYIFFNGTYFMLLSVMVITIMNYTYAQGAQFTYFCVISRLLFEIEILYFYARV